MVTQADLLARGYFPRELPPPFQTRSLGGLIAAQTSGTPLTTGGQLISNSATHNVARTGSLRRELSIPNPIAQTRISGLVSDHWPALEFMSRSMLSQSFPVPRPSPNRAILTATRLADLNTVRVRTRARARHILNCGRVSVLSLHIHTQHPLGPPWQGIL